MALYRFEVLGDYTPELFESLRTSVENRLAPLGLRFSDDVEIVDGRTSLSSTEPSVNVAVFFGSEVAKQYNVSTLLAQNIPIVAVASTLESVNEEMPQSLAMINCLSLAKHSFDEIATALFECAGLLPKQRKIFISYTRCESRNIAIQLFEALLERHYTPFLDTHSIMHSTLFQENLRHELCDSGLFIMLHTEKYMTRKWAIKEYKIAGGKQIPILRVDWPGMTSDAITKLAIPFELQDSDLTCSRELSPKVLKELLTVVETARSQGHFVRMQHMLSNIKNQMNNTGAVLEGIGPGHTFYVKANEERRLFIHPLLAMPTAEDFYRTHNLSGTAEPTLVIDSTGAKKEWRAQLDWMREHISGVKCFELNGLWPIFVGEE